MITKKIKYKVKTTKKCITVTDGFIDLRIKITDEHIALLPTSGHGQEFGFMSTNEAKTVARWEEIIDCMKVALQTLKEERKLK